MNKFNIKDILTKEEFEKVNLIAYDISLYCENNGVTPLDFIYVLLHLIASVKEADKELNTDFGLLIDLYL